MSKALIVVDVQNDFCEGGSLAVAGGNLVANRIGWWLEEMHTFYDRIYFTKDTHLPWPDSNGGHFSETPDYKDSWPVHCVHDTPGSMFHPDVVKGLSKVPRLKRQVFYKGVGRPDYSGFQGRNNNDVALLGALNAIGCREIDVCGIAGDYCVAATARDARTLGFEVTLLPAMIASVGGDKATWDLVAEFENGQV